jgi:hypothetical protein
LYSVDVLEKDECHMIDWACNRSSRFTEEHCTAAFCCNEFSIWALSRYAWLRAMHLLSSLLQKAVQKLLDT